MSYNLTLIHPDPALHEAVTKTFEPYWPHGKVVASTTESGAAHEISITLGPEPKRLAQLVWQAEQRLIHIKWPKTIQIGHAILDTTMRTWQNDTHIAELTEKEVSILVYLVQASRPVSRHDLLRDVWRYAPDAETHTIETHIHRLRQKIEADPDNPLFLLTGKEGYHIARK